MKLIRNIAVFLFFTLTCFSTVHAQLYKIDLQTKTNKASLIVEGKVISQYSFWNDEHNLIYTANKIRVYKLFKGKLISKEIEILTQGGSVGNSCLKVSDVLQLKKEERGMFFLYENAMNLHSPATKQILYDVYSSKQGFLSYDEANQVATAPFAKYEDLEQTLYKEIKQRAGIKETVIDNSLQVSSGEVNNGTAAVAITSFSPTSVNAGALNDVAHNVLTINGSGFGDNPSGSAAIKFKDANNDNEKPDYKIAYNSPYIISWSDTKITLNVPESAGTGKFAVVTSDGTSVTSPTNLQVFFAVLDAEFTDGKVVREPRLMNTNGSGGYTIQFSTSTAGNGIDFTASPAEETFLRAMTTWKEITGANFIVGETTSVQKIDDDDVNIVAYDNENTGVPKMADGVLESTYSWFKACQQGSQILIAQKTGFDILIRNDNVSTGSKISFEEGPCFPASGTYDLEMIILHELGHALNLAHINDDNENGGGGYPTINPSKLMHYSILDYVDRRSPDASAYQGALYEITPQKNTYGNCGLFSSEMTALEVNIVSNDECPSTFPASQLEDNTTVNFDLIHATSNKFTDPSYKQVNCKNTGTSVTNNVYYAFLNGTNTTLSIDISGYTTIPDNLKSCSGQGIRMALYDVQACPVAQSYPQPVSCANFDDNGNVSFKGLQTNHKYLLYIDGIRNTKASFNAILNGDGSGTTTSTTIDVFPNPVITNLSVRITNTSGSFYEYALFDAIGKQLLTGKTSVSLPVQTFAINMQNIAAGVYFLRVVDDNGKKISTTKILKL